jgi:hypothetical protein
MDRIYTTNDEDLQFHFKKWDRKRISIKAGWSNTLYFEQVGQKKRELRIDIKLSNIRL